jgi:hypothetical protein
MIVGLDFDNTIVCYDKAIALLAEQKFDLPGNVPRTKVGIRDHLRSIGQEDAWTLFQGELYGPGMAYAHPFVDVVETLQTLQALGHQLVVISHRTRFPYLGERYDLHSFANGWLQERLPRVLRSVAFHESKADKVADVARMGCDFFLDDLPEILSDPQFPKSTLGILFSPTGERGAWSGPVIDSWRELSPMVVMDCDRTRS